MVRLKLLTGRYQGAEISVEERKAWRIRGSVTLSEARGLAKGLEEASVPAIPPLP